MNQNKSWIRFMVSVAMACTNKDRPDVPLDKREAAEFLLDVLHIALNDRKHQIQIEAVPYPVTTKVPLTVRMDGSTPYLFWYYPMESREQLVEDVAELVLRLNGAASPARLHA